MDFRKIISIPTANRKIEYSSSILSLGSCFSENIGEKLVNHQFDLFQNPNGIIFNPMALSEVFNRPQESDWEEYQGKWFSWRHHGSFSTSDKKELKEIVEKNYAALVAKLDQVTHAFVTIGSAWGYLEKSRDIVVANCHKMPQANFDKKLTSVEDIVKVWSSIILDHPHINWIFTVSPVRHWRDGVRENNVSKGVLHQSIHELLKLSNVSYFPSYEIVLDELRDYRFFKDDFLHPNDLAISYVWERFSETYFDANTKNLVAKIADFNRMKSHRIVNQEGREVFERKIEEKALEIKNEIDQQKSIESN